MGPICQFFIFSISFSSLIPSLSTTSPWSSSRASAGARGAACPLELGALLACRGWGRYSPAGARGAARSLARGAQLGALLTRWRPPELGVELGPLLARARLLAARPCPSA